jgi:hypothetical protein
LTSSYVPRKSFATGFADITPDYDTCAQERKEKKNLDLGLLNFSLELHDIKICSMVQDDSITVPINVPAGSGSLDLKA